MGLDQHRKEAPVRLAFAVITIRDTRTGAQDTGGAYLVRELEAAGHAVAMRLTVRDEREAISAAVQSACRAREVDVVLTTGGTGLAARDVTFDTLRGLLDSEIPGFGELFRWLSYQQIGAAALLSRAIGGLIGHTVVLALPGSPKALELALRSLVCPRLGTWCRRRAPAGSRSCAAQAA